MSERGQRFAEKDAQEQRITELYVAAVEQLGSHKAAVRLGGIYALERLGQDNPKLRQTVIDVSCAYLRMPYTPPAEVLRGNAEHSPEYLAEGAPTPEPEQQAERREELQVRLSAQRLIRNHTHVIAPGEPTSYWRGPGKPGERMTLDLTGAVLVDFDPAGCQPGRVTLVEAQFHGGANLRGAHFHESADLSRAQFYAAAYLGGARFHGDAYMEAQFHRYAYLDEAQFHGFAYLGEWLFHEGVNLRGARVSALVDLPPAWTAAPMPGEELLHVKTAQGPTRRR